MAALRGWEAKGKRLHKWPKVITPPLSDRLRVLHGRNSKS
jgi:hypothetical protein